MNKVSFSTKETDGLPRGRNSVFSLVLVPSIRKYFLNGRHCWGLQGRDFPKKVIFELGFEG